MTDARLHPALPRIAARMPPRSGIVIRAHALPKEGRADLIRRLRQIAKARRHLLIWSGSCLPQGFDGRHGGSRRAADRWLLMPVHDDREKRLALRQHATAVLISPVFSTRTHPGASGLGVRGFGRLAAAIQCPVIALGGMNPSRFQTLRRTGAYGWAAIDGWSHAE